MISALEWVPAGVADPCPKKYEFSPAELELIQMMENGATIDEHQEQEQEVVEEEDDDDDDNDDDVMNHVASTNKKKKDHKNDKTPSASASGNSSSPTPTPASSPVNHGLPADLRMDEYSSDDDENDDNAVQGTAIGRLLLEYDGDGNGEQDLLAEQQDEDADMDDDDDDDDDSDDHDDSDDDSANVPDTREYMPVDIEGLKAMGFSQVGTSAPTYMDEEDGGDGNENDENDSEAEDVQIHPDDAVLVIAKTEDDFASLEVHVYEQDTGNLFVHHDIPLPAFPLCLAHGDISPNGTAGNFCAVGTFGPGIEIWNLDVLNALEPSCILGGEDTSMADEIMRHNMMKSTGKKYNKTMASHDSSLKPGSHTDAVMTLSWNKVHRQVIASGSADHTVKLWDVTQAHTAQANAGTLTHHKDKVQSVLWHPQEGTLLATGSYDRTVCLVDARNPGQVKRVKIPGDCEALAWDPHQPQYLTAASEDGTVTCWDVRKFDANQPPLWSMVASEFGGVSDLSYNPHVPGMMVTCSVDKTVTLWDTHNANNQTPPTARMNKDMRVGKLYTVNFYPSTPWLMGCAGGAKEMALWDMTREDVVQKCFGKRLVDKSTTLNHNNINNNDIKENPIPNNKPVVIDETAKKAAFDAMMTATEANSSNGPTMENDTKESHDESKSSSKKKKKDKSKKKKKVHLAGK